MVRDMIGVHCRRILRGLIGFSLMLSAANWAGAEALKLRVADKPPPAELDASIRSVLQPKAVQLLDGDTPVFEFWFRSEVPLAAKPASTEKAMDALRQPTLIGAVVLQKERRDYKDNVIATGLHTMRFALQPQNGDHLGTADFNYFLVLVPAKRDAKLDAITDYKALVNASSEGTTTEHPVIISLRPANSTSGEFPALSEPAPEHKAVRLKLPAKVAGAADKTELAFDLVYEGKSNH